MSNLIASLCAKGLKSSYFSKYPEKSREKQIEVSNIVLNKRGFAFVDLQDNVALDKAIEKLSGMKINGKEISVEHSGESELTPEIQNTSNIVPGQTNKA